MNRTPTVLPVKPHERDHRGKLYQISPAHRVAEMLPWLSDDQLQALADNIKANGQKLAIKRLPDGQILDGRNRELACRIAGVGPLYESTNPTEGEIPALVASLNLFRRHLTPEERQGWVVMLRQSGLSTRAIADAVGVSDGTVRNDLKAGAQFCAPAAPATVTGADGKHYPSTRSAPPALPPEPDRDDAEPDTDLEPVAQATPLEPVHPFADVMAGTTQLATALTRAINGNDDASLKLKIVFTLCGLVDYPPGGNPRVLPLAGVHALLDLAGLPGPLPSEASVRLIYDRANGSWVPPLTARRRERKKAVRK